MNTRTSFTRWMCGIALIGGMLHLSTATAQESIVTTPHASMYLKLGKPNAVKVTFQYSAEGTPTPISWGMDTAWDDEGNVLRGVNFIGADNLTYGRISFQVMDAVDANGNLSTKQKSYLRSRLQHIAKTKPDGVLLNSDPEGIDVQTFTHHPEEFYKVIKATVKYAQEYGLKVVSIAPFNEPDVTSTNQGDIDDFKALAKLIREDSFFDGIRICAGNTCNDDRAMEWYEYMKPYVDEGNTHQLAGTFDHYAEFYTKVKADGNVATNDELHNVMEGIVGAQYGMENGIWWGPVGPSRGDFCIATSPGGSRLGYAENRNAWSGAAVYRLPDGRVKAFAGVSERQAFPSSYEYMSTDRPLYFDGDGPYYSYTVSLPGGYRYGDKYQKNAERSVHILQGEDVPLCPLINGGNYIIVNKKSQKILTIQNASTTNSAAIVQYDNRNGAYQQWTLEALKDNGGDLTGYYLHSVRNANMNMETGGFQVAVGGTVSVYPVTNGENQRWTFEYAGDGYYRIRNYQSGLYLEVLNGNTANNAAIRLSASANDDHQLWRLLPVDATCETVAPAVPTGLTATPKANAILLNWDANTQDKDFNGFLILRGQKNAAGGIDYDVIGRNIMTNSFLDNSCREGITYYYAIESTDYAQNRSEKSAAVSACATGEKGLVARYEFEQSAADLSGNLFDGVCSDASGFTTSANGYRSGHAALLLDGFSNYMQIPATTVDLAASTIAAWVYNSGTMAEGSRFFDFGTDADHQAYCSLNQDGGICLVMKNGELEQTLQAPNLTEGWHHVALTIGEDRIAIYVDGAESATAETVKVRLSDIHPVCNYIGSGQTADVPLMNGSVDDLRIYNYALSQGEIAQVMSEAEPASPTDGDWPQPVVPGKDIKNISSSDLVYLYNVDADAFVTYGMNYNTQSLAQRLAKGDMSMDSRFRVNVTKQVNNKLCLSMRDKSGVYIGCLDDANNVWSDRPKTEATFTYQSIYSSSGKLYTLKSDVQNDFLDVSYAYGGPLTTRNGRGYTHWAFIPVTDVSNGNYAKYKERKRMYAVYQAVMATGRASDFASELQQANQTYTNADATVQDLRAATRQLIVATATGLDSEIDASALFTNADMLGNNTTKDWTETTTTIKDGDIEVKNKPVTLQQTQADLPNGIYEVRFHGFYRNDETGNIPVVSATAQNVVKDNLTAMKTVLGQEVMLTADETTAGAAQMQTSSYAQNTLTDIIVDNHQMTLNVTVTSSAQWLNFQGFDIIYKRPFVSVEVPASGVTTFYYSNQNFLLPEGMEAYTFMEKSGEIVVSSHFADAGTVLPAGQAVVLTAKPGIYYMLPTTKTKMADLNNQLRGSDTDQLTYGGNYYYALSEREDGQPGWNWSSTNGAVFVNPAHKAYFVYKSAATPQESFPLGITTSISSITSRPSNQSEAIYNLAGQRVNASYRSLVIKNGKVYLNR